ncbi:MAG: response regulator transcription factor [Campylobacterota bacterium]|nr:response regulator transcription factor [Campylobacterota bacterium]
MNDLNLLCVEDDVEALEDIAYLLKRHFGEVYKAIDGQQALDIYKEKKPDIILLDINIPKINGLKVAANIREIDEETPIIFLSAHSEKDKLLEAIELQVSSYMIKPFKIQELKDVILKNIEKVKLNKNIINLDENFIWSKDTYELYYKDIQIATTKNEILLIKILLENKGNYLTVNEIAFDICTSEKDSIGNNIVQLISRFKKKIIQYINSEEFFIENRYGNGYRIK